MAVEQLLICHPMARYVFVLSIIIDRTTSFYHHKLIPVCKGIQRATTHPMWFVQVDSAHKWDGDEAQLAGMVSSTAVLQPLRTGVVIL